MHRPIVLCSIVFTSSLVFAPDASAQGVDFTFFLGRAFPVYEDHLTLRPSLPSLPGVEVTTADAFEIRTDGGLVFGGAVGFELGILALEGRLDATDIGFDTTAARIDLRATEPPVAGLTGNLTIGAGRFNADRLYLLSGNVRLRTPGPVALVVSGGISLLPDIAIAGSAPIALQIGGIPVAFEPRLRLRAAPEQSEHRIGVNGGAGLRIGGGRLGLVAEARAFYFREYELRLALDDADELLAALLDSVDPIRFEPIIVNAQVGLVVRF